MSDWPEQIGLRGADFHIVAIQLGMDRNGRMRYAMRFENGEPVRLTRMQYRRSSCGLVFASELGPVVFEFDIENEEE